MARRFNTKAVLIFLCLALLSCREVGASPGHFTRRSLAEPESDVFQDADPKDEEGGSATAALDVGAAGAGAAAATGGGTAFEVSAIATGGGTVFDVSTNGAKPDGLTNNFAAFVETWKAVCSSAQPATLLIPAGKWLVGQVEFQGPCKAPVTVDVKGTVLAVSDITQYPTADWVRFEAIDGLTLTGGGTFDGNGAAVWKYNNCDNDAHCKILPTSLKFSKSSNVVIRDITSVNSKAFHYFIFMCTNLRAENLKIIAPADSPNTDGIHISASTKINITRSEIGTGDDCVSLGQGSIDVTITDTSCGPGHGISVGSLGKYPDEEDVSGITVRNCTMTGTTNGARIKTWPGSPPSAASKIIFEDITVNDVKNPVIIDQEYWGKKSGTTTPSNVRLNDIQFRNIKGTSTSEVAVSLICSKTVPCEGVQLQDIDLSFNGQKAQSACANAKVTTTGILNPAPGCVPLA